MEQMTPVLLHIRRKAETGRRDSASTHQNWVFELFWPCKYHCSGKRQQLEKILKRHFSC